MRPLVIAAAVGLGLVVLSAIVYYVRLQMLKRRERSRLRAACANTAGAHIFIEMLSCHDTEAAAQTLASAFEQATCALRLHAGVYELEDGGVKPAYERLARGTKAPYVLSENVRVLSVPAHSFRGALVALEQLERRLYDGEAFVCMVRPGTLFQPGWDDACIALLRSAANPAATALTTLPGARPAHAATLGTFVAVEPHSGELVARQQRTRTSTAHVLPALACTSAFLFCAAPSRMLALQFPADLRDEDGPAGVDTLALDYFITMRLLAKDWTFVHPVKTLVFNGGHSTTGTGSAGWRQRVKAANAPFAPALAARGISTDARGARVTAQASLGLLPNASDAEIVAKLGSVDAFLSEMSRLELDQPAAVVPPPQPS